MSEPIYIRDYDYPLPDERIAKYPLAERDRSRLLLYKDGAVSEDVFCHIGRHLPADTLLVYNNTRVLQARLLFRKETGARIEVFCLSPLEPADYQLNLSAMGSVVWECMVGNFKKWKGGALRMPLPLGHLVLTAELLSTEGNTHAVRFSWNDSSLSFAEVLEAAGELPIPPYLNRPTEESDKVSYQTVYSRVKGSVAAPTAGLHFTQAVLDSLRANGVRTTEVTLHVGAGTFQPVKTADANLHTMHTEVISVPRQAIADIRDGLGRVCAVGTTSMRTLESLYYIGLRLADSPSGDFPIQVGQFEPYERDCTLTASEALGHILAWLDRTGRDRLCAETQIMIRPGYRFRITDMLITNFHQPKSTLLLLVSAFLGGDWRTVYDYALANGFRFLSYGDSSLLFRREVTQ